MKCCHYEGALQLRFHLSHFCILCHSFIEGEPPPRSTPRGAYRTTISHKAAPLYHLAFSVWHSLTLSLVADRRTVVEHVPMDHTCSFYVHQSHRHDSTQPSLFTRLVALCEPLVCSYDISHSRAQQASITSLAASSVSPIQVLTGFKAA